MKAFVMTLAAAGILSAPFVAVSPAMAEDAAAVSTEAAADAHKTVTLADGTNVVVKDGAVFVVAEDGSETPAPDGDHATADGHTVTVKDGMLVE